MGYHPREDGSGKRELSETPLHGRGGYSAALEGLKGGLRNRERVFWGLDISPTPHNRKRFYLILQKNKNWRIFVELLFLFNFLPHNSGQRGIFVYVLMDYVVY